MTASVRVELLPEARMSLYSQQDHVSTGLTVEIVMCNDGQATIE
jgi:hypothetical protein